MAKFLIGVGTAALWLVLSYAANADPAYEPAGAGGSPLARCHCAINRS